MLDVGSSRKSKSLATITTTSLRVRIYRFSVLHHLRFLRTQLGSWLGDSLGIGRKLFSHFVNTVAQPRVQAAAAPAGLAAAAAGSSGRSNLYPKRRRSTLMYSSTVRRASAS